jgi:hypothetical protein
MATAAADHRAAMARREGDATVVEDVLKETAEARGPRVAVRGPGDQAVLTGRRIALAIAVKDGNRPLQCPRSTCLSCRRKRA